MNLGALQSGSLLLEVLCFLLLFLFLFAQLARIIKGQEFFIRQTGNVSLFYYEMYGTAFF